MTKKHLKINTLSKPSQKHEERAYPHRNHGRKIKPKQ